MEIKRCILWKEEMESQKFKTEETLRNCEWVQLFYRGCRYMTRWSKHTTDVGGSVRLDTIYTNTWILVLNMEWEVLYLVTNIIWNQSFETTLTWVFPVRSLLLPQPCSLPYQMILLSNNVKLLKIQINTVFLKWVIDD